jgi:predicted nucleic acid-binding protein
MTELVVIDASAAAAWVLPDERSALAEELLGLVMSGELDLLVPSIWSYEMSNLLVTATARNRITAPEAHRATAALQAIPVRIAPIERESGDGIVSIALDLGLSAYDAAYVLLAQSRGLPLVTADRDILRLRDERPWIRPLDEFMNGLPR